MAVFLGPGLEVGGNILVVVFRAEALLELQVRATAIVALVRSLAAEQRHQFVLDVFDCSQQALAHGFALDRLAVRYPAESIAGLSREARSELRTMSDDHRRTLRKELDSLFERLAPLAGEVRAASASEVNAGSGEVEPASLVPDLQKLDRIVAGLVSGSDGAEKDPGTLVREYQAAMKVAGFTDFSHLSLEGYVNAKVTVEGLRRAGRTPGPATAARHRLSVSAPRRPRAAA